MSYRVIQCVVAWVALGLCLTMRTRGAGAASPNTATLGPDASATQWLWANDTLLGPTAQNRVGVLFVDRATKNPF